MCVMHINDIMQVNKHAIFNIKSLVTIIKKKEKKKLIKITLVEF